MSVPLPAYFLFSESLLLSHRYHFLHSPHYQHLITTSLHRFTGKHCTHMMLYYHLLKENTTHLFMNGKSESLVHLPLMAKFNSQNSRLSGITLIFDKFAGYFIHPDSPGSTVG